MNFTIKPRPRRGGYSLESEALSHGKLWYDTVDDAVGFAVRTAGSARATIELCDWAGKVIAIVNHPEPRGPYGSGSDPERENGSRLGKI